MVERAAGRSGVGRILTVPNLVSMLRLAGVPVFLWLLLGPHADIWAIIVLALGGISDWADGKLARLLNQYSRLGELLDPAADRLYILAALLGLGLRGVVPWWAVGLLVGRDVLLAACLPLLRRRGFGPPPVAYLGKAATFLLLWTFPLLLGGLQQGWFADLCRPAGYAGAVWGSALYLYTGALYLVQMVLALRVPRARTRPSDG